MTVTFLDACKKYFSKFFHTFSPLTTGGPSNDVLRKSWIIWKVLSINSTLNRSTNFCLPSIDSVSFLIATVKFIKTDSSTSSKIFQKFNTKKNIMAWMEFQQLNFKNVLQNSSCCKFLTWGMKFEIYVSSTDYLYIFLLLVLLRRKLPPEGIFYHSYLALDKVSVSIRIEIPPDVLHLEPLDSEICFCRMLFLFTQFVSNSVLTNAH